jgi:hypothetical protein
MGNSFYGGQDARPFIIKKTFKNILEMTNNFKEGIDYLDVNFEEYVLINTENKNNPDNGKIFKRGYDIGSDRTISYIKEKGINKTTPTIEYEVEGYESGEPYGINKDNGEKIDLDAVRFEEMSPTPAYGAEYIGTIVGPTGAAPHLKFVGYDEINTELSINKDNYKGTIEYKDTYTPTLIKGYNGESTEDYDESKYTDKISWKWCSIRTPNNETTTVYMGFQIPYPIFHFFAESIEPYEKSTIKINDDDKSNLIYSYSDLMENSLNKELDFYHRKKIFIPKGIHGRSLGNIRIFEKTTENENEKIYKFNLENGKTYYEQKEGESEFTLSVSEYDLDFGRQVLVGDFYDYETDSNGQKYTIFLGEYNTLESVDCTENGTLSFSYTYKDPISFNEKINWIEKANFDIETGKLDFVFNNSNVPTGKTNAEGKSIISEDLNWIKAASFNNGLLDFTFVNKNGITSTSPDNPKISKQLNWIEKADFENGILKFIFNNEHGITPTDEKYPNVISDKILCFTKFRFNKDKNEDIGDGIIKYELNDGTSGEMLIPLIQSASINDNGNLVLNCQKEAGSITVEGSIIKRIEEVKQNEETGKITFVYTDKTEDSVTIPYQNIYFDTPPEEAPIGSVWAVIEEYPLLSNEVSV